MSLSHLDTISSLTNFRDMTDSPTDKRLVVALGSNIRSYNIDPLTTPPFTQPFADFNPYGTSYVPDAIAMMNATTAAVMSFSSNSAFMFDYTNNNGAGGGYSFGLTSRDFTPIDAKPHMLAGQASKAVGCAFTSGKMVVFNQAMSLINVVTVPWLNTTISEKAITIIKKNNSFNYIVATDKGKILEIELTSGNELVAVSEYNLPQPDILFGAGTVTTPRCAGDMASYINYLLVTTNYGELMLFDHAAGGKLLQVMPIGQSGHALKSAALTVTDRQTVIVGHPSGNGVGTQPDPILEIDMCKMPMEVRGHLNINATNACRVAGIQGTRGWVFQESTNQIHVFSIAGERSITVLGHATNDPGSVGAEMLFIEDNGPGLSQMLFTAFTPDIGGGSNIPLTASTNVLGIASRKFGQNQRYSVRRNNT